MIKFFLWRFFVYLNTILMFKIQFHEKLLRLAATETFKASWVSFNWSLTKLSCERWNFSVGLWKLYVLSSCVDVTDREFFCHEFQLLYNATMKLKASLAINRRQRRKKWEKHENHMWMTDETTRLVYKRNRGGEKWCIDVEMNSR